MNIKPESKSAKRKPIRSVSVLKSKLPSHKPKKLDPFFSSENIKHLKEAVKRIESGHYVEHDIIEADE
ncbi:MAG: hypothetical protein LBL93_07015 [Ruminococcus sp.]|nr:hypothetical protein [Ruminococcus sp.]